MYPCDQLFFNTCIYDHLTAPCFVQPWLFAVAVAAKIGRESVNRGLIM